jgi:L-Lysine epsilon oxidase N-terminal/L-lysine epsilon oxidase C-terminal domain
MEHMSGSTGGADQPVAVDCASDPIASLKAMFVDTIMGQRIAAGQDPALRPVFLKPHGVAAATFSIRPDLPERLRVGVFAGRSYRAWVRFSSDTLPAVPDLGTTCGVAIKLFDVPGPKLHTPDGNARTHDFLLQNHDVFFVDTARDMCEFTQAGVVRGDYGPYLAAHPETGRILSQMRKLVPSVLASDYWSVVPYAFGPGRHVKYKLVAVAAGDSVAGLSTDDPGYLHVDLRERLLDDEATFHFCVQLQTDAERMPLDAATVRWSESASPPLHVATLTLPRQDVDAPGQARYGEDLAYNPWHALAEHAPVGSVALARKVVYQAAAELRREHNHVPLAEPAEPRPVEVDPEGGDRHVVRAAIHPSIGIARVGDSQDGLYVGPETDRPVPLPPGALKDPSGALKREAARFRIYGYNAAGEAVAELTAQTAEIEWRVHVANTKAAWYEFQIALDIPEASGPEDAPPSLQRNADVTGAQRAQLVIDPGARTIRGADASGPQYRFDSGAFFGRPVYLGELRTDEAGRLLFLGGRGVSASKDGTPPTTYANNDGWHDDVSDGPVTAKVTIDGRQVPVDPAWVVVAPPNYAPEVVGVRTMYDLLFDVNVQSGSLPFPDRVSFVRDVLPIFERLTRLGWVNQGFAAKFGPGGREHFLDPAYLERLASGLPEHQELRNVVYTAFRDWDRDGESPVPWPWVYGDAMSLPPVSARQHSILSATQMRILALWAAGLFEPDFEPSALEPVTLDELPLARRPAMLDRAALTFCLADAFHPGCEMTWPMRHPTMYMAPFRLRHRAIGHPEPNPGTQLTPVAVGRIEGPLYGQSPGSLTRWMAVPWQADTASCRSGYYLGYDPRYDPYVPTFWAARVPNQVLAQGDYEIVMDESRPLGEREEAFARRAVWLRWLSGGYLEQLDEMVGSFGKLGVVQTMPGPADGSFGPQMLVETDVGFGGEVDPQRNMRTLHVPEARDPQRAEAAVAAAVEAAHEEPDQITAGYIEKVDRFRRGQRR